MKGSLLELQFVEHLLAIEKARDSRGQRVYPLNNFVCVWLSRVNRYSSNSFAVVDVFYLPALSDVSRMVA